ncbi:hypothetical protein CSUI_002564, partial [Cystoisospora suis]
SIECWFLLQPHAKSTETYALLESGQIQSSGTPHGALLLQPKLARPAFGSDSVSGFSSLAARYSVLSSRALSRQSKLLSSFSGPSWYGQRSCVSSFRSSHTSRLRQESPGAKPPLSRSSSSPWPSATSLTTPPAPTVPSCSSTPEQFCGLVKLARKAATDSPRAASLSLASSAGHKEKEISSLWKKLEADALGGDIMPLDFLSPPELALLLSWCSRGKFFSTPLFSKVVEIAIPQIQLWQPRDVHTLLVAVGKFLAHRHQNVETKKPKKERQGHDGSGKTKLFSGVNNVERQGVERQAPTAAADRRKPVALLGLPKSVNSFHASSFSSSGHDRQSFAEAHDDPSWRSVTYLLVPAIKHLLTHLAGYRAQHISAVCAVFFAHERLIPPEDLSALRDDWKRSSSARSTCQAENQGQTLASSDGQGSSEKLDSTFPGVSSTASCSPFSSTSSGDARCISPYHDPPCVAFLGESIVEQMHVLSPSALCEVAFFFSSFHFTASQSSSVDSKPASSLSPTSDRASRPTSPTTSSAVALKVISAAARQLFLRLPARYQHPTWTTEGQDALQSVEGETKIKKQGLRLIWVDQQRKGGKQISGNQQPDLECGQLSFSSRTRSGEKSFQGQTGSFCRDRLESAQPAFGTKHLSDMLQGSERPFVRNQEERMIPNQPASISGKGAQGTTHADIVDGEAYAKAAYVFCRLAGAEASKVREESKKTKESSTPRKLKEVDQEESEADGQFLSEIRNKEDRSGRGLTDRARLDDAEGKISWTELLRRWLLPHLLGALENQKTHAVKILESASKRRHSSFSSSFIHSSSPSLSSPNCSDTSSSSCLSSCDKVSCEEASTDTSLKRVAPQSSLVRLRHSSSISDSLPFPAVYFGMLANSLTFCRCSSSPLLPSVWRSLFDSRVLEIVARELDLRSLSLVAVAVRRSSLTDGEKTGILRLLLPSVERFLQRARPLENHKPDGKLPAQGLCLSLKLLADAYGTVFFSSGTSPPAGTPIGCVSSSLESEVLPVYQLFSLMALRIKEMLPSFPGDLLVYILKFLSQVYASCPENTPASHACQSRKKYGSYTPSGTSATFSVPLPLCSTSTEDMRVSVKMDLLQLFQESCEHRLKHLFLASMTKPTSRRTVNEIQPFLPSMEETEEKPLVLSALTPSSFSGRASSFCHSSLEKHSQRTSVVFSVDALAAFLSACVRFGKIPVELVCAVNEKLTGFSATPLPPTPSPPLSLHSSSSASSLSSGDSDFRPCPSPTPSQKGRQGDQAIASIRVDRSKRDTQSVLIAQALASSSLSISHILAALAATARLPFSLRFSSQWYALEQLLLARLEQNRLGPGFTRHAGDSSEGDSFSSLFLSHSSELPACPFLLSVPSLSLFSSQPAVSPLRSPKFNADPSPSFSFCSPVSASLHHPSLEELDRVFQTYASALGQPPLPVLAAAPHGLLPALHRLSKEQSRKRVDGLQDETQITGVREDVAEQSRSLETKGDNTKRPPRVEERKVSVQELRVTAESEPRSRPLSQREMSSLNSPNTSFSDEADKLLSLELVFIHTRRILEALVRLDTHTRQRQDNNSKEKNRDNEGVCSHSIPRHRGFLKTNPFCKVVDLFACVCTGLLNQPVLPPQSILRDVSTEALGPKMKQEPPPSSTRGLGTSEVAPRSLCPVCVVHQVSSSPEASSESPVLFHLSPDMAGTLVPSSDPAAACRAGCSLSRSQFPVFSHWNSDRVKLWWKGRMAGALGDAAFCATVLLYPILLCSALHWWRRLAAPQILREIRPSRGFSPGISPSSSSVGTPSGSFSFPGLVVSPQRGFFPLRQSEQVQLARFLACVVLGVFDPVLTSSALPSSRHTLVHKLLSVFLEKEPNVRAASRAGDSVTAGEAVHIEEQGREKDNVKGLVVLALLEGAAHAVRESERRRTEKRDGHGHGELLRDRETKCNVAFRDVGRVTGVETESGPDQHTFKSLKLEPDREEAPIHQEEAASKGKWVWDDRLSTLARRLEQQDVGVESNSAVASERVNSECLTFHEEKEEARRPALKMQQDVASALGCLLRRECCGWPQKLQVVQEVQSMLYTIDILVTP